MLNKYDKSNISMSYNNIAHDRNEYKNDTWEVSERIKFMELLKVRKAKSILDAGAGNGWDSLYFKEHGFNVISADISDEMIYTCREKGLEAYVMDFYKLEFNDDSFDAVWSLNSLLHVSKEDFSIVLDEFNRVLKPEGLLYIGIFGGFDRDGVLEGDNQIPKRFFNAYTDENIKKVVSQHFELIKYENIDVNKNTVHLQSLILKKGKFS
jgi:ubiquinone/menaquinone biosynthesis C-methylase UbiE